MAELPVGDLRAAGQRFFAFEDGAAFGGYALTGPVALLRSLVPAVAGTSQLASLCPSSAVSMRRKPA